MATRWAHNPELRVRLSFALPNKSQVYRLHARLQSVVDWVQFLGGLPNNKDVMNTPYLYVGETRLMLQVKADLDRHEGFREFAYPDPLSAIGRKYRGKDWPWGFVPARELLARIPGVQDEDGAPWTYGFGFTHCVNPDSRISRILAERMLEGLIIEQNLRLKETFAWYEEATFVTKTVLINMAFNLGLKGLLKFKNTLRYIRDKNYNQAATNMTLSLWYNQVGSRARELVSRMRYQRIEPLHLAEEVR